MSLPQCNPSRVNTYRVPSKNENQRVIAVDGPSSSGKSTLSQRIAVILGCSFLETGAMYRALAYHLWKENVDLQDPSLLTPQLLEEIFANFSFTISIDPLHRSFVLNGEDVSVQLRSPEVTNTVSIVAAIPYVREKLVAMQRELVRDCALVVVEGRDIGTVVFPDAVKKIFLIASAQQRAQRRALQDATSDVHSVLEEIEHRDLLDSTRAVSPLRPAQDAIIVDVSDITFDQSVSKILDILTCDHVQVQ